MRQEIELSLAKCRRDYRFAIPQIYFGETAFLLPIYFNEQKDKSKPAVLCSMTKKEKKETEKKNITTKQEQYLHHRWLMIMQDLLPSQIVVGLNHNFQAKMMVLIKSVLIIFPQEAI